MPLELIAQVTVDAFRAAEADLPPPGERTVAHARERAERARRAHTWPPVAPPPIAAIDERTISGSGGPLPIRIYTPPGASPYPGLVYFHGGGWTIGDLDMSDAQCRAIASGSGCVVVSVDYRLAPEHKFPAGVEDCFAATRWVSENAATL